MEEVTFDNPIKSKEFLNNTVPQIRDIDKAELRQLCDRFIQMSYFAFNGSFFVVTHAGLPDVPDIFTPTQEMIKGVGKYEDHELIDAEFEKNTPNNFYQIHGHRNSFKVPIRNGRTFNLEGGIEFGGHLRVLEILKEESDVKFDKNAQYVLNTSSKKIHSPECSGAKNMSEKNKETVKGDKLKSYINNGYELCGSCLDK